MGRRGCRLALWALGWTLFEWWAVIGWPDSAETAEAALAVASAGSMLGLTGWYGLQRLFGAPGGADRGQPPP